MTRSLWHLSYLPVCTLVHDIRHILKVSRRNLNCQLITFSRHELQKTDKVESCDYFVLLKMAACLDKLFPPTCVLSLVIRIKKLPPECV